MGRAGWVMVLVVSVAVAACSSPSPGTTAPPRATAIEQASPTPAATATQEVTAGGTPEASPTPALPLETPTRPPAQKTIAERAPRSHTGNDVAMIGIQTSELPRYGVVRAYTR